VLEVAAADQLGITRFFDGSEMALTTPSSERAVDRQGRPSFCEADCTSSWRASAAALRKGLAPVWMPVLPEAPPLVAGERRITHDDVDLVDGDVELVGDDLRDREYRATGPCPSCRRRR